MPAFTKLLCLGVASLATYSMAQFVECNRADVPNWDDCTVGIGFLGWAGSTEIHGNCDDTSTRCTSWTYGACQLGYCFNSDECDSIAFDSLAYLYFHIQDKCRPEELGGEQASEMGTLEVILNRGAKVADASGEALVTEQRLSQEEFDDVFGHMEAHDGTVAARQDVTWTTVFQYNGVTKPGERVQVSQEINSGVTETWSTATSTSISVSLTAGVSAGLFDIFTVSAEVSTSYTDTLTITSTLTYTAGNCPGQAIVYWSPVFDRYEGVFSDNEDETVSIWVARELNGGPEGRFETDCLGV